ncbi:MAG: hypothetical protein GPW16_00675 [Euryarchaeota archaeon]|jgi:hypothetical protein|nr:hypothetical protein [Euryarchaeota archaeon]
MKKGFLFNFIEKIIEKINKIENLPNIETIEDEIKSLNEKIEREIDSCSNKNLKDYFTKFLKAQKQLILRKRINSGVALLIYFIYTILGSLVGIIFLIGIFFTTQGFIGHVLIFFSLLGSIVSIFIGIWSIRNEMDLTRELLK